MPATLVNHLMACHWMARGIAVESATQANRSRIELMEKINEVANRKVKFDF